MRRLRAPVDEAAVLSRWLLCWLAARLGGPRRGWMDAVLGELDAVPPGPGQLLSAPGGVRPAVTLRWRTRSRRPWRRHPLRPVALLLGAPPQALGGDPAHPGTAAYLVGLACAAVSGTAVVVLRGLLEDSPYAFNLGRAAPAGVHPDLGNPMSLAWDLVVLAASAELLTVIALSLGFVRSALLSPSAGQVRALRRVRAALLVSAFLLWVMLGATLLWGIAAHVGAPALFDRGRVPGLHLTRGPWLGIVAAMAASAAASTEAGLIAASRRPGRGGEG